MKKILFTTALLSILLFSCKKDHINGGQPVTKTYNVQFTVAGLSQSTVPFQTNSLTLDGTTTTDTLKNSIDILYYLVYKNNAKFRDIVQHSTDPGFGTINDSFAVAGNGDLYQVVLMAGKTDLTEQTTGTDQFQYVSAGTVGFFNDSFYKSISFTTPATTYNLTLNRVVSQLQVVIKDPIPANASKISVIFNDYQNLVALSGLPANLVTRTVQQSVTPGATNTTISSILLNTGNTFSVELKCTDASNNALADKTITGVTCVANETTVLTGDLFTGSNSTFNVTYSPVWNTPTKVSF